MSTQRTLLTLAFALALPDLALAQDTTRVSVDSSGTEGNNQSRTYWSPRSVSADGKLVVSTSNASNLVAGDTNGFADAFVHDRATGITERVSVDASGAEAIWGGYYPSISADGEVVAFTSISDDLVSGDTNNKADVFARERCDAYWSNYGAGFAGTSGVPSLTSQSDPVLGTTLTLDLANSSGSSTAGLLFVGYQRAQIHSGWGGDLLVIPVITILMSIPAGGSSISDFIPDDDTFCDLEIDLQAIESDPGAARRVSFTPGLALVLGR